MDEAGALLGRHYSIDGTVVHGEAAGATLGFPTANLESANELLPARHLCHDGDRRRASSIRRSRAWACGPRIGDGPVRSRRIYSMAAKGFYGKPLRLAFVKWMREERKFDGLDALKAQIALDCARPAGFWRDHRLAVVHGALCTCLINLRPCPTRSRLIFPPTPVSQPRARGRLPVRGIARRVGRRRRGPRAGRGPGHRRGGRRSTRTPGRLGCRSAGASGASKSSSCMTAVAKTLTYLLPLQS